MMRAVKQYTLLLSSGLFFCLLQKIVDRLEKHSDDDLSMFLSLLERMDQPKS